MFSMMSISPQSGQPTVPMSAPSIQNAGQMPWPARELQARLEAAVGLLEPALGLEPGRGVVAGVPSAPVKSSRRAVMTSVPSPARAALRGRSV